MSGALSPNEGSAVGSGRPRIATVGTEPPGAIGGTGLPGTIVRCSGLAVITGRDRVTGATVPIMVLPLVSWLILSPGSSGVHQTEDSRLGGHANIEDWFVVARERRDRA